VSGRSRSTSSGLTARWRITPSGCEKLSSCSGSRWPRTALFEQLPRLLPDRPSHSPTGFRTVETSTSTRRRIDFDRIDLTVSILTVSSLRGTTGDELPIERRKRRAHRRVEVGTDLNRRGQVGPGWLLSAQPGPPASATHLAVQTSTRRIARPLISGSRGLVTSRSGGTRCLPVEGRRSHRLVRFARR
jgi:hypothetical protein